MGTKIRRQLVVYIPSRGSGSGGTGADVIVHQLESEYGRPVHRNMENIIYMHREREDSGIEGADAVVVTGGDKYFMGLDNNGGSSGIEGDRRRRRIRRI